MRGIDAGIDLGRRQAGMAEQFLERAKIGAASQQMGSEAVAQCVRRGALAEAEADPRRLDGAPDELRRQRPAPAMAPALQLAPSMMAASSS